MGIILKPFFVVPLDFTVTGYVSSDFVAGFPQSNVTRFAEIGKEWRNPVASSAYFGGDFGATMPFDFFAALNTNAQVGTTQQFTIRTAPSPGGGVAYTTGAIPLRSTSVANPFGKFHSFNTIPAFSANFFDYTITSHTGTFQMSHFIIGKKIEFEKFYDLGFAMGFEGFDAPELSAGGVADIQPSAILRTLKFLMSTMTKADFHTKFQPLIIALRNQRPCYICFDPQADDYRNSQTYFGWLRKPAFATIGATHPEWHSQEFEMLSQI